MGSRVNKELHQYENIQLLLRIVIQEEATYQESQERQVNILQMATIQMDIGMLEVN